MEFVHHVEMRAHRLVVADAFRVVAMHEIDEFIGQRHGVFFHHFVVADDVDDSIRRNHGDAVERVVGQFDVGDFDDAFSGHTAAVEVVSDGDATFHFVESQQVHHFEERCAGNMVDDDAVLQCCDGHFFLVVVHDFVYLS